MFNIVVSRLNDVISDARTSVLPSGELLIGDVRTEDSYVQYSYDDVCCRACQLSAQLARPSQGCESRTRSRRAELPCVASSYPLSTYTWSKDDVVITSAQARVERKGGNLLLKTALVRDSGRYTCTCISFAAPLSAYVEPSRQTVDVGRPAMLNCTVFGHPVGGVEWFKDGRPLVSNNRVSMVTEHSLRILNVVACPIVYRGFDDETVVEGPGVSLQCMASGNPTPIVQWTLDDSPLPAATRKYSIGSRLTDGGDVISQVNITNVRIQDGGQYK
ncbi:hypothetical protein LSH36_752g02042 [Paralvinella palmiformis]|uniref:Ig-like domain-containing protein n=1 Tax=Paralvinella palmiformis TaxID=53620 RepID=A0AAD9J0L3_9ANNE|nr:hypothetical protein LSH36_752g02042 [Paralvinella palmiformis]